MPEYAIRIPAAISITTALTDLPPPIRALFRQGFAVIAALPVDSFDELIEASKLILAIKSEQAARLETARLAKALQLEEGRADAALAVATLLTSFLSVERAKATEIIERLIQEQFVDPSTQPAAVRFVERLEARRREIVAESERQSTASETLPSFRRLTTSVDLRFSFADSEQIKFAVPVAVAHLTTDATHESVWFQMSLDDVKNLIRQLEGLLERLQSVDKLASAAIKAI